MNTVSVIIPTYNCARFITEAVESVLTQTHPASQIIVIDDGSKDDTAERMKRYADRILFIRQNNQGVSAARNAGIAQATGKFIAFLDSDDVWHPRKLELHLAEMDRHPDFGLIGTSTFDWPHSKGDASLGGLADNIHPKNIPWKQLVVKNYFTTSSVIVRRDVLVHAGPFSTSLQGPEDYDLWLRIAEISRVGNIPLPLTGYRATLTGLGNHAVKMEAGMALILQRLMRRQTWRTRGSWLLRRKAYAYFRVTCALMYGAAGLQPASIKRLLLSMAGYPLPFRRAEAGTFLLRPKMLAVAMMRWLRLKSELPNPAPPNPLVTGNEAP